MTGGLSTVDLLLTSDGPSTMLYRIAQTRTLRTYVNVPQVSANSVHVGQAATLTVSNFPGRTFRGNVTRTANALDPASRTMLVEVGVPNADGALIPGTYAEVDLSGAQDNPPLIVPAAAIIFRTAALWRLFNRNGWNDRFEHVEKRLYCLPCWYHSGIKRRPSLTFCDDPPTDTPVIQEPCP